MTDHRPTNEKASPAGLASSESNFSADSTVSKPDIDLASWAALGSNVKPSRTDRKPKRGWKRGTK